MNTFEFKKDDSIDVVFADGDNTCTANISLDKLKELILDEAFEIISEPSCSSSSCSVNNFCECDPINEDMEFSGIFVNVGEK